MYTGTCCPRFDPAPWDGKTLVWKDKRFLQDRVTSLFHIPLNYGTVMARGLRTLKEAGAQTPDRIILTDENSLWGADVYFETGKEIAGARMASLSGTFLCKVFEGQFRDIGIWINEMKAWVAGQGKAIDKLYFYYTTCPKCAKVYGKNHVVILARVGDAV